MTCGYAQRLQLIVDRLREAGTADACASLEILVGNPVIEGARVWLHRGGRAESIEATHALKALDAGLVYAGIGSASDALALLDSMTALECAWDGPIPQDRRDDALAKIAAARAWMERHPAEVAAEREARREALLQAAAVGDARWAEALPRRPDAAMVGRVVA